jgi:lactoylglutathione lyase
LNPSISGLSHIGIRVHELARSRKFYELLGFELAWGPSGREQVTGLTHACGLEINLIVNARESRSPNILMDAPLKHAGITHVALKISDVAAMEAALIEAGVPITGRRGQAALFVRDPDGVVLELAAD